MPFAFELGTYVRRSERESAERKLANTLGIDSMKCWQPRWGGVALPRWDPSYGKRRSPNIDPEGVWVPTFWLPDSLAVPATDETADHWALRVNIELFERGVVDLNPPFEPESMIQLLEEIDPNIRDRIPSWLKGQPDDTLDEFDLDVAAPLPRRVTAEWAFVEATEAGPNIEYESFRDFLAWAEAETKLMSDMESIDGLDSSTFPEIRVAYMSFVQTAIDDVMFGLNEMFDADSFYPPINEAIAVSEAANAHQDFGRTEKLWVDAVEAWAKKTYEGLADEIQRLATETRQEDLDEMEALSS